MNKVASKSAKGSKRAPTAGSDDVFPAAQAESNDDIGPNLWSCTDRDLTMVLSLSEGDDEPFISAHLVRPTDDTVRIEMRSNSVGEPKSNGDWGKFYVPIKLVPYLGIYFTEMVARATRDGILRVGNYEIFQDIETVLLPPVAQ